MKPIHLLMLICASFLTVSPAYAHGDEVHDGAPVVVETAPQSHYAASMDGMHHSQDQSAGMATANGELVVAETEHDRESDAGFFGFLTKLHPATVHFPVALFLMAALAELFIMAGRVGLEPAMRVLIYGGAAGSVLAASFGWIHTGPWFGGDTVMQVHRWNGMLIVVFGLALVALVRSPRESRSLLRTGLFVMAALILVQGFLGGELAHGQNHLGLSWL